MPLQVLPRGLVVPILQGPCRGMRWVIGSGTHGCWLGSYEAGKIRLFAAAVQSGRVVYDIGANVGIYTLAASRLVGPRGQVIAFEPLPRNVRLLERHVRLNLCENVRIIPEALCHQNGLARFDEASDASQGHLASRGALEVKTARLDDVVLDEKLLLPDIMKVDVEGAEADVLLGAERAISGARPEIFLATHGDEVKDRCMKWLRDHRYQVEALGGQPIDTADEFRAWSVA